MSKFLFDDNTDNTRATTLVSCFLGRQPKVKMCFQEAKIQAVGNIGFFVSAVPSINPLPDGKILDWSKLKQIADDMLKCI